MSNYVLSRVGSVKIGAVGAAEGACTDIGSVREVEFAWSQDVEKATSSALNDATVEVAYSASEGTLSIIAEEITANNLALAMGATVNGSAVEFDGGGGTPTYKTVYVRGYQLDGSPGYLHIKKCAIKPEGGLKLGKEQQLLTMEFVVMADPTASNGKMAKFGPLTIDTTPPTISSTTPASNATAVAVSSTFVWTFSEAVRADDVTNAAFYVFKDTDGSAVAGTVSVSSNVVTFTPASNLTAATAYRAVAAKGVRDVAGNALVATDVRKFTTA